jgi:ribosomal protein L11 methyltransferase
LIGGPWTTVHVRTQARAAVIGALFENGAEAIQETGDALVTHFRDVERDALNTSIRLADPRATVEYSATPDVDWNAEWHTRIHAHRVGRLVVTPPWLADQFPARDRVVIEPGMAFGTGEHESTRGVLRLMEDVIRPGCVVADLGAGSAVLSIAAAKLGAGRAIAIELDPEAIGNAQENVDRNMVAESVTIVEGDAGVLLPLVAPVHVVLANIVSSVLLQLLPMVSDAMGADGRAVFGGMLVDEREEMERQFALADWRVEQSIADGAWWSATIARQ